MGKLHELLAVDVDAQNVATKLVDEAITTFSKKPDHFLGYQTQTSFIDEKRTPENTSTSKEMVTTVDQKLSFLVPKVVKHYDVLFQKELANCKAKSNLEVGGQIIAKDVPATYLLTMEGRLKKLRDLFVAIPTLDPALDWKEDLAKGNGVWRADEDNKAKTEKAIDFKVLYEATKDHPAQIEKWSKDVTVAWIKKQNYSGMWTVAHKAQVLDRLDTLIQAIKQARMRANLVEAPNDTIGLDLMEFILNG